MHIITPGVHICAGGFVIDTAILRFSRSHSRPQIIQHHNEIFAAILPRLPVRRYTLTLNRPVRLRPPYLSWLPQ